MRIAELLCIAIESIDALLVVGSARKTEKKRNRPIPQLRTAPLPARSRPRVILSKQPPVWRDGFNKIRPCRRVADRRFVLRCHIPHWNYEHFYYGRRLRFS